jgi:histone deacetylase 1/2
MNGVRRQPGIQKRRNHVNYRNLDVADSGLDSGMASPRDVSSVADEDMDTTADGLVDKAEEAATTEEPPEPSEAKPAPKPDEGAAAETKETAPEGSWEEHSSPMTWVTDRHSDADVEMEDAGAAPPEPEQPPTVEGAEQEKTPPASPPQEPATTEPAPAEEPAVPVTEAPQPTEVPAEATAEGAGEPSAEEPKEAEAEAKAPAAEAEVKAEEQPEKEEAPEPKETEKTEES